MKASLEEMMKEKEEKKTMCIFSPFLTEPRVPTCDEMVMLVDKTEKQSDIRGSRMGLQMKPAVSAIAL